MSDINVWTASELNRWQCINSNLAVREVFRKGAENRTLKFLYATKPGSTLYYVFLEYDRHGDPHDRKMTALQITGEFGKAERT